MTTNDPRRKPHHRPGGFQNNYLPLAGRSLADVLRWRRDARRDGLPPPPAQPTPRVEPDLAFVHANATADAAMRPAVTWIGHATVLAQLGGLNVLTDPMFSPRAAPIAFVGPKRHQPPGLAPKQLPHIDVVLVSHNHYDHLDAASIQALFEQPGGPPDYIVPLGLKGWFDERRIGAVAELDWWDQRRIGGVDFALVPAQHWSGRGLHDRMRTLWGGFAVFAPDCHLFFAGDTGYSRDLADILARYAAR